MVVVITTRAMVMAPSTRLLPTLFCPAKLSCLHTFVNCQKTEDSLAVEYVTQCTVNQWRDLLLLPLTTRAAFLMKIVLLHSLHRTVQDVTIKAAPNN